MKSKKIIVIIGAVICLVALLSGCISVEPSVVKSFDVMYTDAPNGRYWLQNYGEVSGGFLCFHGYFDSDLKESYTIKFMDGDLLRTLILQSGDYRLNVHVTNDLKMDLTIKLVDTDNNVKYKNEDEPERDFFKAMNMNKEELSDNCFYDMEYTFDLYIPTPDICNQTVVI